MSDNIDERGERSYPKGYSYPEGYTPYVQGWKLETSDINPVHFYKQEEPEQENRIARWLDFIDR